MLDLRLKLIGTFQAEVKGEPVTGFLSNKVRALLAYLAIENDRPHSRDRLSGLLWPGSPDQDARASLRTALANLRKVILDDQANPPFLEVSSQSIRFCLESNAWVDLNVFKELTRRGELDVDSNYSHSRINSMERAVELSQGTLLEGFYLDDCLEFEEWVGAKREWFNRLLSETLGQMIILYEGKGDYSSALRFSRRQLELEPWNEVTHQGIMQILALTGNRSSALAQYEACRRVLTEELDIEPAPETTHLYHQIRAGKFGPPVTPTPALSLPVDTPVRDRKAQKPPQPLADMADKIDGEEIPPVFVARQNELACLSAHLKLVLQGKGRSVFVVGEAGSGKTALMDAFARLALQENGDLVVIKGKGSVFSGIGDPYQPFRESLQMLSGIAGAGWTPDKISKENAHRLWSMIPSTVQTILETAPGLLDLFLSRREFAELLRREVPDKDHLLAALANLPVDRNYSDVIHHPLLFEEISSLLQILSQEHPMILILDDLQWIDRGSAALLFHLSRHLANHGVMILGAYRPNEIARGWGGEEHPLKPVVQELTHLSEETIIDLDQADGMSFIKAWIAKQPVRLSDGFCERLHHHTRGHPLFTIELMKDMQDRGELSSEVDGGCFVGEKIEWSRIPGKVEAVLDGRLQRLPESYRNILSSASVEGEEFTAEILAQVQDLPIQKVINILSGPMSKSFHIIEALDSQRLTGARLSHYRFRHSLFQKYFYQQLDQVKRANLHEAVGDALEKIYIGETFESDLVSGPFFIQLAHHFEEANINVKAAQYLLKSGDYARQMYSYEQALDYYQRALVLLKSQNDYEGAARTLMKLGLLHHTLFQFSKAHQVYSEAFTLWQTSNQTPRGKVAPASQALRVEWGYVPSIDPAHSNDLASGEVNNQLFSGLLSLDFEGNLLPDLAASWEVAEDGCRYVFKLREGLYWTDGVPLTAGDFEYAWKRVLLPATKAYYGFLFYPIQGAQELNQGETSVSTVVGIKALNERTLQVDLVGPTSFFPYLMTLPQFRPVPKHIVEQWGSKWTDVDKIQTNGPFRLLDWEDEKAAHFAKNPAYHAPFAGNVDHVELILEPDWQKRLHMYQANELDVLDVSWLPPREAERVRLMYANEYVLKPLLMTGYVGFNLRHHPFDNCLVRQAFALAVDKQLLTDVVGRGHFPPATGGFVPPGMPGHMEGVGFVYDPSKARRLLAEAGYPGGSGLPTLEFLVYPRAILMDLDFVCTQWEENIGVHIETKAVDFVGLIERLQTNPPHLHALFWIADYPDPDSFLRVSGAKETSGWQNPAYDLLISQAARASDQDERVVLYQQADRLLISEVPILPLIYGRQHLLVKPWVDKFPTSTQRVMHWKDVVIR